VTTVLDHFKGDSLNAWKNKVGEIEANRVKNVAAARGTRFHSLMEEYICNNDNSMKGLMPDMAHSFRKILPYLNRIDEVYYVECQLYSEKLKIAGRTDVVCTYDGTLSILDFKTSTKTKREDWIQNYFEQATCYSLMLQELTGLEAKQIIVLIAVDDAEPQCFVKNRKDYIHSLVNKIETYHKDVTNVS
jgi:ATP-dependent exoDNAse (exonuclease V) beta subunit